MSFFTDKTILVTGGTGSIGSEVVRQLLAFKPKAIRVLSRDEHKQYLLERELGTQVQEHVRYLLGDVRDYQRMLRAMEGVDFVFHCAAYKHVPFCEYNSFEAVKTNVIGTQNVIDAAIAQGVGRVLLISTDKAASPSNVMGATKLLAEKMMTSAMHFAGPRPIRFASVRFGNVLASRGSVLPLFCKQIEQGGPVTVTDPKMIRFFMSIPQAVSLLFRAMERMEGGELFILKMPVLRLGDMIDVLIEELAPRYGRQSTVIRQQVIGARPGEKMEEILMTAEEAQHATEEQDMFVVHSQIVIPGEQQIKRKLGVSSNACDSSKIQPLTKEQIRTLLSDVLIEYFRLARLPS
ncbi:MAG: polysaccharide biosynthesis protein [Candidatus Peribacteraceae bacterium]|jgi:FlaA1/EpsC-like NDP-sugar epimerase|nr:polysaccharide biosynthesis protein [Candidatus Peribacteraceae bacterium]